MKIKEIGFVGIPVTDMTKARAFYEDVLGLKPDPEMTGERWTEGKAAALEVESLEGAIARLKEHKIRYD